MTGIVRFKCPQCAQPFEAEPGQLRVATECPNCGRKFLPSDYSAPEWQPSLSEKQEAARHVSELQSAESAAGLTGGLATILLALGSIIAFIMVANGGSAIIAGTIFFAAFLLSVLGHILSRLARIHASILRVRKMGSEK